MAGQVDRLNQMSFLMSKILLAQNLRRRYSSFRRKRILSERITNLYRIRKIYSRLCEERMLYLKMLTSWIQANTFRRGSMKPPSQWFEKIVNGIFGDRQWIKYFRMKKETFLLLVEKLKPHLSVGTIPVDKKIAITLFSLASGKRLENIARLFGVRKRRVSLAIKDVCNTLVQVLLPQLVKAPKDDVLKSYIDHFETKWGFPQCAGVLSYIHIPICMSKLPENSSDYINNDGGYSIYLQGIVDPSYKFWDVNIGWPGSIKESRVLTASVLWAKSQDGKLFPNWGRHICGSEVPICILTGSSYPLTEWLMKPFQVSDTSPADELKFNECLTFACSAAEIAFKRLKARWNCLVVGNVCNIDIYPNVATACCILHNICENAKEPLLDEWIVKAESLYRQPLPSACCSVIGSQAENIRHALKNYFQP